MAANHKEITSYFMCPHSNRNVFLICLFSVWKASFVNLAYYFWSILPLYYFFLSFTLPPSLYFSNDAIDKFCEFCSRQIQTQVDKPDSLRSNVC
mmetsp:Transcript_25402/g.29065  ORF Transcript_25402/g.29065 Transcript_25402/m.29065 type:complete len:94 (+) Transcript_25402:825-1106(+)